MFIFSHIVHRALTATGPKLHSRKNVLFGWHGTVTPTEPEVKERKQPTVNVIIRVLSAWGTHTNRPRVSTRPGFAAPGSAAEGG